MAPPSVIDSDRPKKRRRKKKARTEDFSSDSDSSDSDQSNSSITKSSKNEKLEVEYEALDLDTIEPVEVSAPVVNRHPNASIPQELRQDNNEGFEEYFVNLITNEFGDELDQLRQSKDFQSNSLLLLVNALKQGTNIFDPKEREQILASED